MNHQQSADYRPVFILCPGRSFSSVVCGMLGQHPELYGLPETNFFVADTVGGLFQRFAGPEDRHRIDGLVRTLAQLHEGDQTEATAEQAWQWLRERLNMPTRDLAWHIAMHGGHRQIVEKSPSNCEEPAHLVRLYRTFPSARFLHLLRHPYSSGKSLYEFHKAIRLLNVALPDSRRVEKYWLKAHRYILRFTERLPVGQSIRLQGELLLADPDRYLRQIAEWLEIRNDSDAIKAMKHPENSPFAMVGPNNAQGGNDYKYLKDPYLRISKPSSINLSDPLEWMPDGSRFSSATIALAQQFGYR